MRKSGERTWATIKRSLRQLRKINEAEEAAKEFRSQYRTGEGAEVSAAMSAFASQPWLRASFSQPPELPDLTSSMNRCSTVSCTTFTSRWTSKRSARVHHPDVGDQNCSIAPQVSCPNSFHLKVVQTSCPLRSATMKIYWKSSARTSPSFSVLEEHGLQTARRDAGAVQRAAQKRTKTSLQYSKLGSSNQGSLEESELRCPAKPAGLIPKCCPRASTGSLWSSRNCTCSSFESYSSANMLRVIAVINSEDCHQKLLPSQLTLAAQRQSLVQEVTAEMMRRNAHSAPVEKWTSATRNETKMGTIWYRRRKVQESKWRSLLRMPVMLQKLHVYTLENLNYPPESRCEIKRRSCKDSC